MIKTKRYIWLDIIKIVSCFFVIINHSHSYLFNFAQKTTATVLFDSFFLSLCKSAVPIFVMTTGYLLLKKENTYKKVFSRIFRIIVPLIILSVLHYFVSYGKSGSVFNFIGLFIKDPQSVYLWYLYMLIGLYLISPFVSKIVKLSSTKELTIFVSLFLLLPSAINLIPKYLGYTVSSQFFIAFFPKVMGYFVGGVLIAQLPLKKRFCFCALSVSIVSILWCVLSTYITYKNTGKLSYDFDSWYYLPIVLLSVSLYYIVRFLFEQRNFSEITEKIISSISSTTFGIYLLHYLVLVKMSNTGIFQSALKFNSFLGVIFIQLSCFICCSIIVLILKKIPIIKRFL